MNKDTRNKKGMEIYHKILGPLAAKYKNWKYFYVVNLERLHVVILSSIQLPLSQFCVIEWSAKLKITKLLF